MKKYEQKYEGFITLTYFRHQMSMYNNFVVHSRRELNRLKKIIANTIIEYIKKHVKNYKKDNIYKFCRKIIKYKPTLKKKYLIIKSNIDNEFDIVIHFTRHQQTLCEKVLSLGSFGDIEIRNGFATEKKWITIEKKKEDFRYKLSTNEFKKLLDMLDEISKSAL